MYSPNSPRGVGSPAELPRLSLGLELLGYREVTRSLPIGRFAEVFKQGCVFSLPDLPLEPENFARRRSCLKTAEEPRIEHLEILPGQSLSPNNEWHKARD